MRRLAAIALIALAGLLAWGFLVEPYRLEVRRITVHDPFFARALGGLTVVHLSDLHMGTPGKREEDVLRLLEGIKPDLVLLTGDYVEWGGDNAPARAYLARLRARLGVWAVLGDYDWSRSRQTCLFCHQPNSATLKHGPVHFLKDAPETISPRGVAVDIRPLGGQGPETVPGSVRVERPSIVLVHSPLAFDAVAADAPVLCLAGDTHGGQVKLPAWLWRAVGYEKTARYPQGLYRRGRALLHVSPGIGTSHLPLRLFVRPQVSVLRFVP
jgi:predicted MPP superfamily phosphohydrolase